MKSVVVTGTSSGIGLATALGFARRGFRTFATMRTLRTAHELERARDEEGLDIRLRALDVTDPASVTSAVADILGEAPIDVLVHNAGVAGATPLELVDDDKHQAMFQTNYFGAIRMINAVLPHFRGRGSGTIVNLSSVAGRVAIPNQVPYSASKWALECASEALAHEVRSFGIRVKIIEPGVIMTSIFDNAATHTVYDKRSPYATLMKRNGRFYAAGMQQGTPASVAADAVVRAATDETDQLRYVLGADAVGWIKGREVMSDEQWVAMGGEMSDDEYNRRFLEQFSIQL